MAKQTATQAAEVINFKEISEFIKLRKIKAELLFKHEYFSNSVNGRELAKEVEIELKNIDSQLVLLEEKFKRAGFSPVMPFEYKIAELSEKINANGHDAIADALLAKTGPLYILLAERGGLLKQNFDMRDEIAKLNLILSNLDSKTRSKLENAVRRNDASNDASETGSTGFDIKDGTTRSRLAKIFKRLNIPVLVFGQDKDDSETASFEETEINVDNKKVWVPLKLVSDVQKNLESSNQLLSKIQLKNAEHQIRVFADEEENEFAKMQNDYLVLLKQRDELLKEHYSECEGTIIVSK